VSLGIRLSRCVCVRRISLGGKGNALYPVLSCQLLRTYVMLSFCALMLLVGDMKVIHSAPTVSKVYCRGWLNPEYLWKRLAG